MILKSKILFLIFLLSNIFFVFSIFSKNEILIPIGCDTQERNKNSLCEVRFVNQEKIGANRLKISRVMKMHWFLRTVRFVGALGIVGYAAYSIFKKDAISGFNGCMSDEISKKQYENLCKALRPPKLFSVSWFKKTGKYICDLFAVGYVMNLSDYISKKFLHDDNIKWFSKDRTYITELICQVKAYSKKINESKVLSPEDFVYYRTTILGICRELVRHVEKIGGFMEYSLEQFKNRGALLKPDEILQVSHLVVVTNQLVKSVLEMLTEEKVGDAREKLKALSGVVHQFVLDLEQQINRFSGIENAIEGRLLGE